MVECKYTSFDRVMNIVKELPKNKKNIAIEIAKENSFEDLLDFCVENKCFTMEQSNTIYDFIIMFENLEDSYYEEDTEKYLLFLDKIGLKEDLFKKEIEVL